MMDRRALAPTPSHNWGELVEGRPNVGDTTSYSWAQYQQHILRQKGLLDGESKIFRHQHCLGPLAHKWLLDAVGTQMRGAGGHEDGLLMVRFTFLLSAQRLTAFVHSTERIKNSWDLVAQPRCR